MSQLVSKIDAEALLVLSAHPDGLGLSRLGQIVGRPPSSIQRALSRLAASGAVTRSGGPRPRYRLADGAPADALRSLARWALPPDRVARLEAAAGAEAPDIVAERIARALADARTGRRLRLLVRRLLWWERPAEALRRPRRLIAQVMTLGTWEDVEFVRPLVGDEGFAAVLDDPPPGVFDPRSWSYWHARLGREPVPALPARAPG
jgi:hypothetical protein